MITIDKTRLDFRMENEAFACDLYGGWDAFGRVAVEKVIDDTLSRYDTADEVIRLEVLTLDLGVLPESGFYEHFPRLLAEKLDEAFADCLRYRSKYRMEVIPVRKNRADVLLFFLLYGSLPEGASDEYRDFSALLHAVVVENGIEFIRMLRQRGASAVMRERLAVQFTDDELESVVRVAEPSEAVFVTVYVRYLMVSHRRLNRPEITAGDYRNVVWQVALAYLLYDGRSFFSRKQMVWQTVRSLAAHFNLDFGYLLQLLASGLETFTKEWIFIPELLAIFSEIRAESAGELPEAGMVVSMITEARVFSPSDREILCRLLSRTDTCHRLLVPLKEEEIVRIVELIIPSESAFIVSYARNLDREKDRGMLEGKAGGEFRILKWEFLFLVLLDSPVSLFHRKRFVWSVVRQIAAHYNMDAVALLVFLYADTDDLPMRLTETLRELYLEEAGTWASLMLGKPEIPDGCGEERARLAYILSRPVSARQFLSGLPELQIYRLAGILIPAESVFIISYARMLDREKDRGMLEGKAGTEFRTLKWEFIFLVVLSAPVSAFGRRQFVRSVLQQIAAHYNLTAVRLLDYFYWSAGVDMSLLPEGLRAVMLELWEEEKIAVHENNGSAPDDAHFEEVYHILAARREISGEVWREAGFPFTLQLLAQCARPEVAAFIRAHRESLREFVFQLSAQVRMLYERVYRTGGMWAFLVAEYGEAFLVSVFAEAGVDVSRITGCTFAVWQEMCGRGDVAGRMWWLKNSPQTVVQLWRECSEPVQGQWLAQMNGEPDLQREWLCRVGSAALRQVVDSAIELQRLFFSFPDESVWLEWLLPCTAKRCANYSYREILFLLWGKLAGYLPESERQKIEKEMVMNPRQLVGLKTFIMEKEKANVFQQPGGGEIIPDGRDIAAGENKAARFYIGNAGLILLAPYIPRLFSMLEYTNNKEFVSREKQIRAVFLLQRLLYDKNEFDEPALLMNKLLAGLAAEEPVPRKAEMTEREQETADSLLKGVMQHWDKMRNTSLQGFRDAFLIRDGVLEETGDFWELTVKEKGYDVLLDSLPWGFSPTKCPWMPKPVHVKWR